MSWHRIKHDFNKGHKLRVGIENSIYQRDACYEQQEGRYIFTPVVPRRKRGLPKTKKQRNNKNMRVKKKKN
jgi:hypothetical protein